MPKWKSTRSMPSAAVGFCSGTDASSASAPRVHTGCPSRRTHGAQALAPSLAWCLRVACTLYESGRLFVELSLGRSCEGEAHA